MAEFRVVKRHARLRAHLHGRACMLALILSCVAGVASAAAPTQAPPMKATAQKADVPGPKVKGAVMVPVPDSMHVESPPPARDTTRCRPQRTILPNGAVKTTFPDGSYTLVFRCGEERHGPDGKLLGSTVCAEVASTVPPDPPSGSSLSLWLTRHGDGLLDEIRMILADQPSDLATYLAYERGQAHDDYQRIDLRTRLIAKLLAP